ncbi:hypothetical protein BDD14_1779 [Edaphobacter modestus]|uniref:Uncharacterized protein n=1 Tax=Edaphobacter modestus TaxID=388466 RepID=A0A4Q7YTE8_9BACT|nr:hypothetical protein BDD14_1779 [Edaphobacter modestus]
MKVTIWIPSVEGNVHSHYTVAFADGTGLILPRVGDFVQFGDMRSRALVTSRALTYLKDGSVDVILNE